MSQSQIFAVLLGLVAAPCLAARLVCITRDRRVLAVARQTTRR